MLLLAPVSGNRKSECLNIWKKKMATLEGVLTRQKDDLAPVLRSVWDQNVDSVAGELKVQAKQCLWSKVPK